MGRDVRRWWMALSLMMASGFAGLGYQIVWTQQCALWLGHESAAVLAVVTAFFGGLAVGAMSLGPRIEAALRPARWYAGCELVVALWSLLLIGLMPAVSAVLLSLMGGQPNPLWQWCLVFGGTFLLLLPATLAMGATLPAMERITASAPTGRRRGERSLAALYASNTFGAVLGVLLTAFWLVPAIGLARTSVLCVVLSSFCGVMALFAFEESLSPTPSPTSPPAQRNGVLGRLALTGLLGIGYEVLVVRVLSQVTENTVYTFAVLLAVYLVGTAIGASIYQRASRHGQVPLADSLGGLLAATCFLGTASLWGAESSLVRTRHLLGEGVVSALIAESVPALLAFFAPTLVMGALFSHLSQRANERGVSFGRALGVNTLGAALAPVLFGVVLGPALGSKVALLLVGAGYLLLVPWRAVGRRVVWMPAGGAVALGLALAVFAPRLRFVEVPEGGRVLSYQDGVMAAVSVVEDAEGVARLRINNRQQEGSSTSLRVDSRQAWLPLLLHPAPRAVLFLGLGTGVTARSAGQEPSLDVDAVELLPEVVAASAHFAGVFGDAGAPPRLHVIVSDARRYVRTAVRTYDVIVSDNFHPARSGSGSLTTVEHFRAVRDRLDEGGLFCQWLPLHQLDLESLRSIVQSFLVAYPEASAVIASNSLETPVLGLIGHRGPRAFDPAVIRARVERASAQAEAFGFEDELAVLGTFVAGPSALRRLAGSAPANTDDHPVVAYLAPRITYAPDSLPRDRLVSLLRTLSLDPREILSAPIEPAVTQRLAAYWAARNLFIESGRNVRPSSRVEEMLPQVREPLLAALRLSPDFRPAYDPLLAMARALAQGDVSRGRELLEELARVQPARGDAAAALASLGAAPSGGELLSP